MAKHDDLELLELPRASTQQDELKQAAQRQAAERPEQDQLLGFSGTGERPYGSSSASNRVNAPHTRLRRRSARRLASSRRARRSIRSRLTVPVVPIDLQGRTALVTGSRGIGRAIAVRL